MVTITVFFDTLTLTAVTGLRNLIGFS